VCRWACISPKIATLHWVIWTSSTLFLEPTRPTTKTMSPSVQLFSHSSPHIVPIHYNGPPHALKIAHSHGDVDPHLIHGTLSPLESSTQTASRSVQPFLQGSLVWQTDRTKDHTTQSITTGRIYVPCSTVMQPKKWSN